MKMLMEIIMDIKMINMLISQVIIKIFINNIKMSLLKITKTINNKKFKTNIKIKKVKFYHN